MLRDIYTLFFNSYGKHGAVREGEGVSKAVNMVVLKG